MRIFVAGASGAIGQPLVAELVHRGHEVTGMTHSEAGARHVADMGAAVAQVSAFDAAAVEQALGESHAEVVIDELTSLPKDPSEMAAAPGDRKLKIEGGRNLIAPRWRAEFAGTSSRRAAFSSSRAAAWLMRPRAWRSTPARVWP
jgi:nucleoside-diphosphate-sugar epimerase